MKKAFLILLLMSLCAQGEPMSQNIYNFKVTTIDGKNTTLEHYKGKVMLIVNVASKCGFTPQYEGLQRLHEKHAKEGLAILGFPCNQFREQEPAKESEIKVFCSTNYNVTFDMFSKIEVNGETAHPLYKHLKKEASGFLGTEGIKWNFTKFLVSKEGKVLKRYGSTTKSKEIEADIVRALGK